MFMVFQSFQALQPCSANPGILTLSRIIVLYFFSYTHLQMMPSLWENWKKFHRHLPSCLHTYLQKMSTNSLCLVIHNSLSNLPFYLGIRSHTLEAYYNLPYSQYPQEFNVRITIFGVVIKSHGFKYHIYILITPIFSRTVLYSDIPPLYTFTRGYLISILILTWPRQNCCSFSLNLLHQLVNRSIFPPVQDKHFEVTLDFSLSFTSCVKYTANLICSAFKMHPKYCHFSLLYNYHCGHHYFLLGFEQIACSRFLFIYSWPLTVCSLFFNLSK